MKNKLITEIEQRMLKQLDNAQLETLHKVLIQTFKQYEISEVHTNNEEPDNSDILSEFLSAKRIEGCSEKSLKYYCKTITAALCRINKGIKHITTDDLRGYLTKYQEEKQSSKVTMDNIRRILPMICVGTLQSIRKKSNRVKLRWIISGEFFQAFSLG